MDEQCLLTRITVNPRIFGGKPIVRGRRLTVEHVRPKWIMIDAARLTASLHYF
jgi:uncharacterized protein (DUF433 family)